MQMKKTLQMTAGLELRELKSEITTFDCTNYQDLTFTTNRINGHIRMIFETHPQNDTFLKNYIEAVVLKHISIIESYIEHIEQDESRLPFVTKALRYHFNCIIDSFTYALLTHQH